MITKIYDKYFQKSTAFLYPLLDIKYSCSIKPDRTHVSWDEIYEIKDKKLITIYRMRDDLDYVTFEKKILLNNPLFCDFKECDRKRGIYVFDLEVFKDDFDYFIEGQYQNMEEDTKIKILSYYPEKSLQREYIQSYLYPENFYNIYAKILGVNENSLRDVKTLCSKPDLIEENLTIKPINNYEQNNDVSFNRI